MKIKLAQNGGLIFTSSLIGTGQPVSKGAGTQPAPNTNSKEDEQIQKFLLELLKEEAIPIDYENFIENVKNDLRVAKATGHYSYDSILNRAKEAQRNKTLKALMVEAKKKIDENDAGREIATASSGQIYAWNINEKKVSLVSPKEFSKNPGKYLALTNDDLVNSRWGQNYFRNNLDSILSLESASSMGSVVKTVSEAIKNFGKSSITGYGELKNGSVSTGMSHIVNGDLGNIQRLLTKGSDGIYKISEESTIADTGIKQALNFLISGLSTSEKHLLTAKAAVEGFNPEAFLLQSIYFNTDRKIDTSFDSSATENSSTVGGNSKKKAKISYLEALVTGRLPEKTVVLNPSASQVSDLSEMRTTAWKAGQMVDKNFNGLTEKFTLQQLKGRVEASKIANTDNVTFGNQVLSSEELKKIIWDGKSELSILMLPFKEVKGIKTPDFDGFDKLNKINKWIKSNQPTSLEINEKIRSNFSSDEIEYDPSTKTLKYVPEKMMKFLSFTCIASDDVMKIDKANKPYLEQLSRSQGNSLKDSYNKVIMYGTEHPTKGMKADKSVGKASGWKLDFEGNGDFYRGSVYMPVEAGPQLAMLMTESEVTPESNHEDVTEKWNLTQSIDASRRLNEKAIENGTKKELSTNFNLN